VFLPVFLFFLWELPAMIVMTIHKMICASRGTDFQQEFLGTWNYRLIGMFSVWPTVAIVGSILLSLSGADA
jgi:hypothetical protein